MRTLTALNCLNMFTGVEFCGAIQGDWAAGLLGYWVACAKSCSTKCVVMANYTKDTGAITWSDIQCMSLVRNTIFFFDFPAYGT